MTIIIGSARVNELGNYGGGQRGDQKQTETDDTKGEVSLQRFYLHKKGWYMFRPISPDYAENIAKCMYRACNNKNIGYSQNDRASIWTFGTLSQQPTNCDCSSLVRQCIKEGTGVDVGNFNTTSEPAVLKRSGLFEDPITVTDGNQLADGDILVTKTQGHTVICVSGNPRSTVASHYYPKCDAKYVSIIDALKSVGVEDTSVPFRAKICKANGLTDAFTGQPKYNLAMLKLLKRGTLKKP